MYWLALRWRSYTGRSNTEGDLNRNLSEFLKLKVKVRKENKFEANTFDLEL